MNDIGNSPSARDIESVIHPYTNLDLHRRKGPMIIEKGKGVLVWDDEGSEYIEGMAGLWCASFGFGEEELIDAAVEQMRKLPFYHQFGHKSSMPSIDLAEKLLEIAPDGMSKVFFANSGSEANDSQVKLQWYVNNALGRPQKKKILARIKGYHGVTVAAASLTGLPANHAEFDLPIANIGHVDMAYPYRGMEPGETEEEYSDRLARQLEERILAEGPDTVAAFIAEPVCGAGGVLVPPAGYFPKIQAVLKKYDIMMIADEVICGFGRTGNMWGSQTYGIEPDTLSCAKQLSSAYLPISAVMVNDRVHDAMIEQSKKIGTFAHGFTYSAHPVCAAVALRTMQLMEERKILDHVREVAPVMQGRMQKLADHPLVGNVRGVGLVGAIELVKDKATKEAFDPKAMVGFNCAEFALKHGLITRAMGDSLGFCPPLIITESEINEMFDRFEKALEDTERWIKAELG
ncbi:MAG: aspartate aminotransferase family protein [Minwuia sp.]|uniref:aspartate aminotransferase family protein n=1 Tax=Minwuia sp. TaxID=2493630 RepID=UPI003A86C0BC